MIARASTPTVSPATVSKRLVLFTCMVAMAAGNMSSFPIAVIMPTIAQTFQVEIPTAQWAMTGHFVALAATMLPIGSAGDILGRTQIFKAGFLILIASLLAVPLSSSLEIFVFLRVLHGVGAGMVMVSAPAIVSAMVPPSERGRALALTFLGGFIATGVGQPLFGAMVQAFPWFSPFLLVTIPSALAFALAFKLPVVKNPNPRPFDAIGAALLMFGCGGLVIGAGHGQEEGWALQHTLEHVVPLLLASVAAVVTYVFHAQRVTYPILPLAFFRSVTFTTGAITNSLAHMTMLMVGFLMPFYLQNALGYQPLQVAMFLVPMSVAMNVMAVPSGWIYDKKGSRWPCSIALFMGAALLFSYQALTVDSGPFDVMIRMVVAGVVLGLFVTPNVSAILGAVPPEHYSLAAGFEQTTRNIGHSVGAVLSSVVATFVLGSVTAKATPETYVEVLHGAGLVAGLLMSAGALIALMRDDTRGGRKVVAREPEVVVREPAAQTA